MISGILHVLKTGRRWRDCPRELGNVADITMAIPLLAAVDKPFGPVDMRPLLVEVGPQYPSGRGRLAAVMGS